MFRLKDKDQFELGLFLIHRLSWLFQILERTCHQHQAPSSFHIHLRSQKPVQSQQKASSLEILKMEIFRLFFYFKIVLKRKKFKPLPSVSKTQWRKNSFFSKLWLVFGDISRRNDMRCKDGCSMDFIETVFP